MDAEINVLSLSKGEERYVFIFDDANRVETLRMLGRYAADPQLSFTWYDAAMISQRIREMTQVPVATADDDEQFLSDLAADLHPSAQVKSTRRF